MENFIIVAIVVFDMALLFGLAYWAARGGTARVLVGLALSTLFGAIIGVPIYVLATLGFRRKLSADPSRTTSSQAG